MDIRVTVDAQVAEKAKDRAQAMGKSLAQLLREYLEHLADGGDVEGRMAELRQLSGKGNSGGWQFDRDELYERR